MARSRYIVGIDLGTTNCAVAYVDTKGRERPTADIRLFEVPQLVAPGETAPRPMLPSFLYLPGHARAAPRRGPAPLERGDADRIVGEFARIQGARVPGHLVASAKSWLCHPGVDREADILPWAQPARGRARSRPSRPRPTSSATSATPGTTTFARDDPTHRLEQQEVVLTVPASFDEAARELTVEAAKRAGLATITLLEEPQAAFYCWIVSHQEGWQREVRGGELILVCDIGGGTTDFSLITVVETPTGPGFRRVAVGDHLMLGGDNIDLALAHRVETEARRRPARRRAVERPAATPAGRPRRSCSADAAGRALAGDDRRAGLEDHRRQHPVGADPRRRSCEIVLDGFFPRSARDAEPGRGGRSSGSRSSACRSSPTRRSPSTWAPSCGGTGPRRSGRGGTPPTTGRPGPTPSSSTAGP